MSKRLMRMIEEAGGCSVNRNFRTKDGKILWTAVVGVAQASGYETATNALRRAVVANLRFKRGLTTKTA